MVCVLENKTLWFSIVDAYIAYASYYIGLGWKIDYKKNTKIPIVNSSKSLIVTTIAAIENNNIWRKIHGNVSKRQIEWICRERNVLV